MTGEPEIVVELQQALRSELKEPLGPIYTDASALLTEAGHPLITVGDVVTYHVLEAGNTPAVALVDEQTERSAVSPEIAETIDSFEGFEQTQRVANPAATLTAELLAELRDAIAGEQPTLIEVEGEEDLAALPAIVLAPTDASVVYGQPGQGMVLTTVDSETKASCRDLLGQMDGDTERLWELLAVDL